MRLNGYVVAFALALPAVAGAQVANSPSAEMKAALTTIENNVAQITFAPEKERWQSNIDLWRIRFKDLSKFDAADMKLSDVALNTMHTNVSRLIEPREKQRWLANRDLWEAALGMSDMPPDKTGPAMRALYTTIRANVDKISEPEEKERWTANAALWKAVLDRK